MPAAKMRPKTLALPLDIDLAQLARCEFFSEFSAVDRRALAAFSSLKRLDAGEVLFEEGQPCQALHLVLAGEVKMNKISPEGKEQVIRRLGPGQLFGAAALFTPQGAYPATAEALHPSVVLKVPKAQLIPFLKRRPDMFLKVLAFVSQHLQDMMRLAESVSLDTVPKRAADLLLTLAKKDGTPRPGQVLQLKSSQAELAAELGTVREVLGRALHQFQKQGWLEIKGRKIVLLDPQALEKAAH